MKFHINKQSGVRPHEQLREQIIFLISTGELGIGTEMPSVRALSRQLGISLNTVSKVYSELVRGCWLIERPGAHHLVVERKEATKTPRPLADLDDLIDHTINLAHTHGYSLQQLAARIRKRLLEQPPDHFLVVAPDPGMGELMREEIRERIGYAPLACSSSLLQQNPAIGIGAILVAPAYLVDTLGFIAPHRRRLLPVTYSPLDPIIATITKLSQPSMIGVLSLSKAGLKTLSGMFAPVVGSRHSIHLFLVERLGAKQDGEYHLRRYRVEEYHRADILRPASDHTSAPEVTLPKLQDPRDDNSVSTADLRCLDVLACDSVAYALVQHPGRIRYQLLSEQSLNEIESEAGKLPQHKRQDAETPQR